VLFHPPHATEAVVVVRDAGPFAVCAVAIGGVVAALVARREVLAGSPSTGSGPARIALSDAPRQ
jgi:hypothetical protein